MTAHASGTPAATADADFGDSTGSFTQPFVDGTADWDHTYTSNGTKTITVTAGAAPAASTDVTISDLTVEAFDPGAHTVVEVQDYVTAHPDELDEIRAAEAAGKARTTLLAWLDAE